MSSKRNKFKCRQRGFSLLELMVTVAVLAIVTGVAAPSFRSMIQGSRLTASSNEMLAVFQSARMEALRTNSRVDVCPSANGRSCGGTNWRRVIVVSQKNGATTVLRDVSIKDDDLSIIASDSISTNRVWYLPDGFVRMGNSSAPAQVGSLGFCISTLRGENARNIRLNMGRASIERAANVDCKAPGNS